MDKFEEQEIKKNKENKADLKKVKFNKKKKNVIFKFCPRFKSFLAQAPFRSIQNPKKFFSIC